MKNLINRVQNNTKKAISDLLHNEDLAMLIETSLLMELYYYAGASLNNALYAAFAMAIVIRIVKTETVRERKNSFLKKMFVLS